MKTFRAIKVLQTMSAIALFMASQATHAQIRPVGLIDEQHEKLECISSVPKRIDKYKRYIHKDSIRFLRQIDNYYKRRSDSLTRTVRVKAKETINKKGILLRGN